MHRQRLQQHPFVTALERCSAPVALIGSGGAIRSTNNAWIQEFQNGHRTIRSIFAPSVVKHVLSVAHHDSLPLGSSDVTPRVRRGVTADYQRNLTIVELRSSKRTRSSFLCLLTPPPHPHHTESDHADRIGTIAHDLKNPLGAILGYSDLLLSEKNGIDQQQRLLARVKTASVRALELLRNYQQLARLERPPRVREPSRSHIVEVFREVISDLGCPNSGQPPIELRTKGEVSVQIERPDLARISSNLLGNALTYTDQNGRITVTVRQERLWGVLEVHTTSIIPTLALAIPRKRADRPSLTHRASAGVTSSELSMYIARQLVTRANGRMKIKRSQRGGTVCTVQLPGADR